MTLIEIYLSYNHIFMLFNCISYVGANLTIQSNIYYFLISILINWLICFLISFFIKKSLKTDSKKKIEKVESSEKGITIKMEEIEKELDDQPKLVDKIKVIIIYAIYHLSLVIIQKILKYSIFLSIKKISILFMALSYYFILKEKIYLHHFISLSVIVMSMFMINDFNNIIVKNIIPSILFYIYTGFTKSYIKYLMRDKFITPYFCSFISTFFLAIRTLINNIFFDIIYTQFDFDYKTVIYFICHSSDCLFEHLILYFFTPFHQIIIETIADFIISDKMLIDYIIFFENLIFILIYNEILILNFFGLGKNTKVNIEKRGELQNIQMIQNLEISNSNYYSNIDSD